ncbi:FAD-binding and (Fe-S)-binding domain-containing protein [Rhizobium sp. AC27/96]|uniref:FAD-binding and (Fe-S)-binding domain-containing protein n=2 Tax=unclassified Rhizobium TaxID=2613769 RepID=UPI001300DE27|nr:FAD-binding and (Fe-S)-binding domain-containing protein [Rhizobium sp. AC27/96]
MPIEQLLSSLSRSEFSGDVAGDAGSRTVFSTDNSIYQVRPAAVIFPKNAHDISTVVEQAHALKITVTARGGGTGTNGQSLNTGVLIDTSRHMNQIEELDISAGSVTVQPGVVLSQLNQFLEPHGYFFPPTVSTASRATIGGMVATDASGKGSRIFGKTSDYIESMQVVLSDGSVSTIKTLDFAEATEIAKQENLIGHAYCEVLRVVAQNAAEIDKTFPQMNRGLTGYNLKNIVGADNRIRLSYLLAGSEGTLAITTSITLKILKRPALRALVPIRYEHFQTALEDVQHLLKANPSAVEIIDDKVLSLAQQDPVWNSIESVLGKGSSVKVGGLNFVEFLADDEMQLSAQLDRLVDLLNGGQNEFIDWTIVTDPHLISELWSLREKSVGLLGRLSPTKQGTAFVEDAAVPPERLPGFVREFREILDAHGVTYGMYGHADVGCLHVRPALNMRDKGDAALIRPISDEVAKLAKKYGGLLWGEHGRGFRGEYSPFFFGPVLYRELCKIKGAFDPLNLFNPGKLAAPDGETIDKIDNVPLRGQIDRSIASDLAKTYDRAVACNGNGACFNWDKADPMCPSYKVTRDRSQSPKGRAALLREWARLESIKRHGESNTDLPAIEQALHASFSTCLSCKACSSQCPIKVDIPAMKSTFLHRYYADRRRPLRHIIVAHSESAFQIARRLPFVANAAQSIFSSIGADRLIGLIDLPRIRPASHSKPLGPRDLTRLTALSADDKARTVILLEDTFTSTFDGKVVDATVDLLGQLGYTVWRAAPKSNGKAAHVLGKLDVFEKIARAAVAHQSQLIKTGVPVVGIEPVTTLMQDHEYKAFRPDVALDRSVLSIEEFLHQEIRSGAIAPKVIDGPNSRYALFLHCMEKTSKPATSSLWTSVLKTFGMTAQTIATGCCGMAGMFGHEIEHAGMSDELFQMSWARKLGDGSGDIPLMTGFSCRCQTERITKTKPQHPVQALLRVLKDMPDQRCIIACNMNNNLVAI